MLARSAGSVHDQLVFPGAGRVATDLFFAVRFPINIVSSGRVRLLPGFGLGVGWMHGVKPAGVKPAGMMDMNMDNGGLRAEAGLKVLFRIHKGLFLDAGLSLDAAFPQPQQPQQPMQPPPSYAWGFLRGALGLNWSTP